MWSGMLPKAKGDASAKLDAVMMQMLINKIEVADVYSPPRLSEMARRMQLKVGWGVNITAVDHDSGALGFNEVEMRTSAERKLLKDEPFLSSAALRAQRSAW